MRSKFSHSKKEDTGVRSGFALGRSTLWNVHDDCRIAAYVCLCNLNESKNSQAASIRDPNPFETNCFAHAPRISYALSLCTVEIVYPQRLFPISDSRHVVVDSRRNLSVLSLIPTPPPSP